MSELYSTFIMWNFFQSCHGKGPSDSEGAAIKCALRGQELHGNYMAGTDDVFEWLEANLTKDLDVADLVEKRRHTIVKRSFHLVGVDAVDHYGGPDVAERHSFRLPPGILEAARVAVAADEARFPASVLY